MEILGWRISFSLSPGSWPGLYPGKGLLLDGENDSLSYEPESIPGAGPVVEESIDTVVGLAF